MTQQPLTVLVAERFAAPIGALLDIPHRLLTFATEGDDVMRAKLDETDVFVSSVVKANWDLASLQTAPHSRGRGRYRRDCYGVIATELCHL